MMGYPKWKENIKWKKKNVKKESKNCRKSSKINLQKKDDKFIIYLFIFSFFINLIFHINSL